MDGEDYCDPEELDVAVEGLDAAVEQYGGGEADAHGDEGLWAEDDGDVQERGGVEDFAGIGKEVGGVLREADASRRDGERCAKEELPGVEKGESLSEAATKEMLDIGVGAASLGVGGA